MVTGGRPADQGMKTVTKSKHAGRTGADEARIRRPAHRGCRGGWRALRTKARQSGDIGARRVGRPKIPDWVNKTPPPETVQAADVCPDPSAEAERGDSLPRCLERPPRLAICETRRAGYHTAAAVAPVAGPAYNHSARIGPRNKSSCQGASDRAAYTRTELLAIHYTLARGSEPGVAEIIHRSLPAHLSHLLRCHHAHRPYDGSAQAADFYVSETA